MEAWQPGPTPDALNAYGDVGCDANGSCGTCDSNGNCSVAAQAPLPGYDYVDSISDGLVYMAQFMGVFQTRSASDLTMTWENWIGYFFDEGSYNSDGMLMPGATPDPEAYYEKLGTYITLLTQLKNQIINIRDSQIPACFEGYWIDGVCAAGGCPAGHWATDAFGNTWWECDVPSCSPNPPCRFSDGVGTVDQERANDEFVNAITAINNQIAQMNIFRSAIMNLFIGMKAAEAAALASCTPPGCCATSGCSSQSCAEYCWTDTRGDHHVLVQLGAYKIPIIKVKKTGNFLMNKTCNYIWPEGWRSGGNMDESQCSVTITRIDPTKSLGPLGYWNPFAWPITKKAWAYYKWDRVGLK